MYFASPRGGETLLLSSSHTYTLGIAAIHLCKSQIPVCTKRSPARQQAMLTN